MVMNNKFKKTLTYLILLLVLTSFTACLSNSASPTASLPLPPLDEPITVSAPDSNGYVTVTGGTSAVPNSSVVIIEVGSSTASLNLMDYCDKFMNTAYAQTCSSDLPQCPTLSSDNKCQYTSSSDGSFTLQVPATTSNQITVSYLDLTTCEETEVGSLSIDDNIISLSMDAAAMVYDTATQKTYIIGNNSSGEFILQTYDSSDNSVVEAVIAESGTAQAIHQFDDSAGNSYLVMKSSAGTYVGPSETLTALSASNFVQVFDSTEAVISDLEFLSADSVAFDSTIDSCVLLGTGIVEDEYFTRLHFGSDTAFYVIEFQDGLGEVASTNITESGDLLLREVYLFPSGLAEEDELDETNISLEFAEVNAEGELLIVMGFPSTEVETSYNYYALRQATGYNFCDSFITLDFSDTAQYVNLGATMGDVSLKANTVSGSQKVVTFIKRSTQSLQIVNFSKTGGEIACFTNGAIDLINSTTSTVNNECDSAYDAGGNDLPNIFSGSFSVGVTDVALSHLFVNQIGETELLLVGLDNGGYNFMAPTGSTSSLMDTDDYMSAILPVELAYDTVNNKVVIIDSGNGDDYLSNLILYDLAETPTLY